MHLLFVTEMLNDAHFIALKCNLFLFMDQHLGLRLNSNQININLVFLLNCLLSLSAFASSLKCGITVSPGLRYQHVVFVPSPVCFCT